MPDIAAGVEEVLKGFIPGNDAGAVAVAEILNDMQKLSLSPKEDPGAQGSADSNVKAAQHTKKRPENPTDENDGSAEPKRQKVSDRLDAETGKQNTEAGEGSDVPGVISA